MEKKTAVKADTDKKTNIAMKEISVEEGKLIMSMVATLDHYYPGVRAPRLELIFENGQDDRRMLVPQNSFEPDPTGKTGRVYAHYIFDLENVFWNCVWNKCRIRFELDYDGTLYQDVPIKVEYLDPLQKEFLIPGESWIEIRMEEPVDNSPEYQPNRLQTVLAVILRFMNMLLGLAFLPWYVIDVLGIMYLGTERKDPVLEKEGGFFHRLVHYVGWRYFSFCRNTRGMTGLKRDFLKLSYQLFSAFNTKKKGILFLSDRRDDMTGNFEFIYPYLEKESDRHVRTWLHAGTLQEISFGQLFDLAVKAAKARVIVVDDFTPFLQIMGICTKTDIVQLWHACGAFKTFGFSRLGKKGGPKQNSKTHRDYSYCFVSAQHIAKYYAEGFGLSEKKVLPYGVPRTDMFFDEDLKQKIRKSIYDAHPGLKGKKVILFAPTFRGNGKISAFYDEKRFDPNQIARDLPEEYVIIIKHHPFVEMTYNIKPEYRERVYDFSAESEINELLFITDILITDYSSVIYEASLLNIPMLFYAYDLESYIASRDFYSGFEKFVPGKIVRNRKALVKAILEEDFEHEKVEVFCRDNFDIRDGKASQRVGHFISQLADGRNKHEIR